MLPSTTKILSVALPLQSEPSHNNFDRVVGAGCCTPKNEHQHTPLRRALQTQKHKYLVQHVKIVTTLVSAPDNKCLQIPLCPLFHCGLMDRGLPENQLVCTAASCYSMITRIRVFPGTCTFCFCTRIWVNDATGITLTWGAAMSCVWKVSEKWRRPLRLLFFHRWLWCHFSCHAFSTFWGFEVVPCWLDPSF